MVCNNVDKYSGNYDYYIIIITEEYAVIIFGLGMV